MNSTDIASQHQQEFQRLRSFGRSLLGRLAMGAGVLVLILVTVLSFSEHLSTTASSLSLARNDLLVSQNRWAQQLVESQDQYTIWLSNHGTQWEAQIFEQISGLLFRSASGVLTGKGSMVKRAYLSLHGGVLRLSFLLLASWRIWVFAIIVASVLAIFSWRVHAADDLLGRTGNNRLFFSGIRATLDRVNRTGHPESQVVGLACPAKVSDTVAKTSQLATLLEKHGALNKTNLTLCAIILKHSEWPAYVAYESEDLERHFAGTQLVQHSHALLDRVFSLRQLYIEGQHLPRESAPGTLPLNLEQQIIQLQQSLNIVLTNRMRQDLASLDASVVASLILAVEAGRVMTYAIDSGRWHKRSNFLQLNARAMLHSIPSFGLEYDYDTRTIIRHALVYGARRSAFGAVRFPREMSDPARVLRQWVEVLLACPHELSAVTAEVELFGLLDEAHRNFCEKVFAGAITHDQEIREQAYATEGNLFLLPLKSALKILRSVVAETTIGRITHLLEKLTHNQQALAKPNDEETQGPTPYAKVLEPISVDEIKRIAAEHELQLGDLSDWSSLRTILDAYGWLARRVGDYSVPPSAIIFAVLEVEADTPGANQFGLIGKSGMVAFRATRLSEKLGKFWQRSFNLVENARMAETREQYEKRLRGIVDEELPAEAASA